MAKIICTTRAESWCASMTSTAESDGRRAHDDSVYGKRSWCVSAPMTVELNTRVVNVAFVGRTNALQCNFDERRRMRPLFAVPVQTGGRKASESQPDERAPTGLTNDGKIKGVAHISRRSASAQGLRRHAGLNDGCRGCAKPFALLGFAQCQSRLSSLEYERKHEP
jgi:hypothetical protein